MDNLRDKFIAVLQHNITVIFTSQNIKFRGLNFVEGENVFKQNISLI